MMPCSMRRAIYVADQQMKNSFQKLSWGSLLSKPASLLGKFPDFEVDMDER